MIILMVIFNLISTLAIMSRLLKYLQHFNIRTQMKGKKALDSVILKNSILDHPLALTTIDHDEVIRV